MKFGENHQNAPGAAYERECSPLLTVKQFCTLFKWPTEAAMRAYIYRSEELCLSEAFIRVGKRVLVSPKRFFELVSAMGGKGGFNG